VAFVVGGVGTAASVLGMMVYLRRAAGQSSDAEATSGIVGRPALDKQPELRLGG
jgi:hypothetical protein